MSVQHSLRFLSWNLNMMSTSSEAPNGWRIDQTESLIRQRILEEEIDIACFQELPAMVPFVETHELAPANTISHSGTIATIVKKELFEGMVCRAIGRFAVVCVFPKLSLTIANVHLESTRGGAGQRLIQLQTLANVCPTESLLIVGDTNTRVAEEAAIAETGLLGKRPPTPTWDSRRNQHSDRTSARGFACYFTRYFHNEFVAVENVKVYNQALNFDGAEFFLSDHFAISGVARVTHESAAKPRVNNFARVLGDAGGAGSANDIHFHSLSPRHEKTRSKYNLERVIMTPTGLEPVLPP